MSFDWTHENPPRMDAAKDAIVRRGLNDMFGFDLLKDGDLVSGEWWRVEENGQTLGYGWMDATWGDAEILLAVDPKTRERGVGSFILEQLEREAAGRGLNYMYNVIPEGHPDPDWLKRWLGSRGFELTRDGHMKRRVRPVPA